MSTNPIASEPFRYWAFICYSHRDHDWADWLHRALESFRIDSDLTHRLPQGAPDQKHLMPIFLDRAQLPATHDLDEAIRQALRNSMFLIVIASQHTPRSRQACREIEFFCGERGARNILMLLIDDSQDTGSGDQAESGGVLERLRAQLHESSDFRPLVVQAISRLRGRSAALLQLIARLINVDGGLLLRRRRRRHLLAGVAAALLVLSITAGMMWLLPQNQLPPTIRPWVGTWYGTTKSTCGYYSGPISSVVKPAGTNSIAIDTYIEPGDQFASTFVVAVSGKNALGPGGLSLTLTDNMITSAFAPSCQTAVFRRH